MKSSEILLVSKDKFALDLAWLNGENQSWQLTTAGSGWEALEHVHANPGPDLIVLDLIPGDSDGMHALRWLRRVRPDLPVLVLASAENANQKLAALRLGAQDFLVRPLQPRQLESAVRRSLFPYAEIPESEIQADEIEQIGDDMYFVAASPTMRKLRAQAELLAQVSAPVFILGENGSGKDLAACLIHKLSVRSGFRFLKLNCATLPGEALENELFGLGGASGRGKPSKLELCQRGTLYLDEITEMPMSLQVKLLHALRDGHFMNRTGEHQVEMDVRILAATQVNIEQAIADRKLREDLYYRLSAFTIHVPALRQRKEEIPLLLGHFMNRLARHYSLPARIFSAAALDACQRHSWPGNLRELKEFVKRYLVMGDAELGLGMRDGDSDAVFRDDSELHSGLSQRSVAPNMGLREEAVDSQPGGSGLKSLVRRWKGEREGQALACALEQVGWNRKAAARLLQISYRTLLYKIEQYHMTPPQASAPGYVAGENLRERNLQRG